MAKKPVVAENTELTNESLAADIEAANIKKAKEAQDRQEASRIAEEKMAEAKAAKEALKELKASEQSAKRALKEQETAKRQQALAEKAAAKFQKAEEKRIKAEAKTEEKEKFVKAAPPRDENIVLTDVTIISDTGYPVHDICINDTFMFRSYLKDAVMGASKTMLLEKNEAGEFVVKPEFNNIGLATIVPVISGKLNVDVLSLSYELSMVRRAGAKAWLVSDKTECFALRDAARTQRAAAATDLVAKRQEKIDKLQERLAKLQNTAAQ